MKNITIVPPPLDPMAVKKRFLRDPSNTLLYVDSIGSRGGSRGHLREKGQILKKCEISRYMEEVFLIKI